MPRCIGATVLTAFVGVVLIAGCEVTPEQEGSTALAATLAPPEVTQTEAPAPTTTVYEPAPTTTVSGPVATVEPVADSDVFVAAQAECICEKCTIGVTKYCFVKHGPGNDCQGIGGPAPDWRFKVIRPTGVICSKMNGKYQADGHKYGGGTVSCTLQDCANP